jgi:hypothetical protein
MGQSQLPMAGCGEAELRAVNADICLHEFCGEGFAQLPCQGQGVGFVPGPLSPLNEAPPTALGLTWKVGRQRREAATELDFRALPRRQGSS